jgi:hypothetical protein
MEPSTSIADLVQEEYEHETSLSQANGHAEKPFSQESMHDMCYVI